MSVPLSIIRPFLSEKIKTRVRKRGQKYFPSHLGNILQVNLLGRETRFLRTHFKPEILPREFGGSCGAYEGKSWAELIIQAHSQNKLLQHIGN